MDETGQLANDKASCKKRQFQAVNFKFNVPKSGWRARL